MIWIQVVVGTVTVAKHQLWIQRAVTERADSVAKLKKMLKKQTCNGNKLKVLQFQIRIRMELDGIEKPVERRQVAEQQEGW